MPGSLGSLVVDLSARTARFERAFTRAERIAQKRMNRIKKITTRIAGGLGGVLGAALAGGISRGAARAASELAAIGDTADKLGLTTDALQELQFAAEQAGVKTQSFNVGFQRFTRRAADAAAGNKALAKTFNDFNIELTDSQGRLKSSEALFADFADAIAASDDQGKRILKTFQLFDTEGVDLVRVLQLGSGALMEFREEARRLGAVVDSSVIERAQDSEKRLNAMQRVIRANLLPALAELAPTLVELSRGFAMMAQGAARFFDSFRDVDRKTNVEGLRNRLTEIQEKLVAISQASAAGTIGSKLQKLIDPEAAARLTKEMDAILARLKQLQGTGGAPGGTAPGDALLPDTDKVKTTFSEIAQGLIRQEDAVRAVVQGREKELQIMERIRTAQEQLGRSLTAQEKETVIAITEGQQEFERILELRAKQVKEKTDQIAEFGLQMARNIQDSFANFLFDPFNDGLDGMLNNFTQFLRRAAAEAASKAILTGVAGAVGGSGFAANLAGLFSGPQKLADGTNFARGGPTIVGERGRELVNMPRGAQVIPNHQLGQMMGGVNVNVNVSGADVAAVGRSAAQVGFDVGKAITLATRRNG